MTLSRNSVGGQWAGSNDSTRQERSKGRALDPFYRACHPQGTSPTNTDGSNTKEFWNSLHCPGPNITLQVSRWYCKYHLTSAWPRAGTSLISKACSCFHLLSWWRWAKGTVQICFQFTQYTPLWWQGRGPPHCPTYFPCTWNHFVIYPNYRVIYFLLSGFWVPFS